MHVYSGADASIEFQQRLKLIKNEKLYWCAVTIEWTGHTHPRWTEDTTVITLLKERLLKTLASEHEKAYLILLQSGDILLTGQTLTNAAYQRVKTTLQAFIAELNAEEHATCNSYDLSVDWDAFINASRTIYARVSHIEEAEKATQEENFIKRLEKELQMAAPLIRTRSEKPAELNLLFVEDEPTIRQILNTALGDTGHHVGFAINGEDAVLSYARKPPHIVFLDINLPDISGLKVLELIAKHDPHAHAVMLTSGAAQEQVKTALQQGVKGYIVKPFSRQKITECIQRYYSA